jgi:hypothetical protein
MRSGKPVMNRVLDYLGFTGWLLGIGYIVLWPLTLLDHGAPFAASKICSVSPLAWLCHFPHPLTLPLGLQLIGILSAAWVCLRLALHAIARQRRARAYRAGVVSTLNTRTPAAVLRPPRRKMIPPLRQVKPRNHFGLRGTPR